MIPRRCRYSSALRYGYSTCCTTALSGMRPPFRLTASNRSPWGGNQVPCGIQTRFGCLGGAEVTCTGEALSYTHPLSVLHDKVNKGCILECRVEIHDVRVRHGRMNRDLSLHLSKRCRIVGPMRWPHACAIMVHASLAAPWPPTNQPCTHDRPVLPVVHSALSAWTWCKFLWPPAGKTACTARNKPS